MIYFSNVSAGKFEKHCIHNTNSLIIQTLSVPISSEYRGSTVSQILAFFLIYS